MREKDRTSKKRSSENYRYIIRNGMRGARLERERNRELEGLRTRW